MAVPTGASGADPLFHHEGHLRRALGVPALVLFGLIYMDPLIEFTHYGIVTKITGGRETAALLLALLVMVFTALSYARMSAAMPVAGSAYTYTQRTFGAPAGLLAGWSLLLDYLVLPMVNYLIVGIFLNTALPAVPELLVVLIAIGVVTALNIIGIVWVTRANLVIVAVLTIFIVTFVILALGKVSGYGHVDAIAPFTGERGAGGISPILAGATIMCMSFLGFDAISTLSEEAKDPKRTVPRAIIIVMVVSGLTFAVLSYVAQLVFPSNRFVEFESGAVDVILAAGGRFLHIFFIAAYIAGALGVALTSQAAVGRIFYAMGRDGILPHRFRHVSPRFSTPVYPILLVSVVSLLAPVIGYATLVSLISFGALVAFSMVNLSVIKHFFVDLGKRNRVLVNLVLPLIGFLLTVWLWANLAQWTLLMGASWLVLGFIWLLVVTRGFRQSCPVLDIEHSEPGQRRG